MSVMSSDQQHFLVMGAVGSSHEATTLPNIVTVVAGSDSSVERVLRNSPAAAHHSSNPPVVSPAGSGGNNVAMSWSVDDGSTPPSDWVQLQTAGIRHIHAMPIRAGPDTLLGVLNLGFKHEPCMDMGSMGPHLFSTYLSLISATLTAVVRDPGLNAYVCLARDLAAASNLDNIMQAALLGSRAALTRLKGLTTVVSGAGGHTWLRLALISGDKSAAALFDDLSQVRELWGSRYTGPAGQFCRIELQGQACRASLQKSSAGQVDRQFVRTVVQNSRVGQPSRMILQDHTLSCRTNLQDR